ncbi:MAG: class I adenylate-forming enzyme family protein [Alphaproteobacteria bacterium]
MSPAAKPAGTEDYASERACRAIEAEGITGNLGRFVREAAARHGDKPAAVFFDDGTKLTYAELGARVARFADGLARIGVGFGDHVGIMLNTDLHYPIAWLATATLGAVAVPLNPAFTPREIGFVLTDSGARFLVVDHELASGLAGVEGAMPTADHIVVAGGTVDLYRAWADVEAMGDAGFVPSREPGPDDPVNIQYTSGTTGLPKGAVLPQGYWLMRGRMWLVQAARPIARNLIAQPFHYVDGQAHFMLTLTGGGTAWIARRQSASRFLGWVKSFGIEFCSMPETVARQPAEPSDGTTALKMIYAYSHRPENYRGYQERFGCPVRQAYGMTELGATLYVPAEADHMTGTGTVGIPAVGREVMIGDAEGRPVPRGTEGEILVRGRYILKGYHNRPDATAAAFNADGWFHTGDVGRQDADGWFYYLGRRKDMIRRSSENISAVEVESVLRGVPGVVEAAVLPVPDEVRGEEVKAYLMVEEGRTPAEVPPEAVLAHCAGNLARYKIPRYLEYVTEFPRTPGGKIRKVELAAGRADLRAGAYDAVEKVWRPG